MLVTKYFSRKVLSICGELDRAYSIKADDGVEHTFRTLGELKQHLKDKPYKVSHLKIEERNPYYAYSYREIKELVTYRTSSTFITYERGLATVIRENNHLWNRIQGDQPTVTIIVTKKGYRVHNKSTAEGEVVEKMFLKEKKVILKTCDYYGVHSKLWNMHNIEE